MWGFPEFFIEIATWTFQNCQPYEDGIVAQILVLTRYSAPLLTLVIFFATLQRPELYIFLFGIGTLVSTAINTLIRYIINDETHVTATCIDVYGDTSRWPSWPTQNVTFVVAFIITYPLLYNADMPFYYAILLFLFYFGVVAGDEMLNYHTRSQIAGGAIVGAVTAFLWQLFIRALVPYFPAILRVPQVNMLGYVDTLCQPGPSTMPFMEMIFSSARATSTTTTEPKSFDFDIRGVGDVENSDKIN